MNPKRLNIQSPDPEQGYLLSQPDESKPARLLIESHAAKKVAHYLGGKVAFDIESATWAVWTGSHWQRLPDSAKAKRVIAYQVELGTEPRGYNMRYLNAIMESIQTVDLLPMPELQAGVVPFKNGLLDVATGLLKEASPIYSTDYVLPHEYDPDSKCDTIKNWLLRSVDDDIGTVELLRAWCAALVRGLPIQKILILRGLGGTGKGTFQRLAVSLVGSDNTATSTLRDLEGNRFELAKHYRKRLCLINEAGKVTGELSMLKAMTGDDWLPLERKHQQQIGNFKYTGAVLIATNDDIHASDSGTGRRKLTVRFDRRPTTSERQEWENSGGEDAVLHREIPGFVRWVLELTDAEIMVRLSRLPARVIADNRMSLIASCNVADWMIEHCICDPAAEMQIGRWKPGEHQADHQLYPHYRQWCEAAGRKPRGSNRL